MKVLWHLDLACFASAISWMAPSMNLFPVCSVSAGLWVLLGLALAPCLWLLCVSLSSHPTASALCQSAHSVLSVLDFCHPTNRSHSRPPELGSFCGFSVGRYYGVGAINALVIALSWGGIATIGEVLLAKRSNLRLPRDVGGTL